MCATSSGIQLPLCGTFWLFKVGGKDWGLLNPEGVDITKPVRLELKWMFSLFVNEKNENALC